MNNSNLFETNDFMNYIAYLEANGLTLDENGNEVPKDKGLTLSLNISEEDDDDE